MSSSRYLNPTTPGGLLTIFGGSSFTATEELTLQNIAAGTYFVFNEVPTGVIGGGNVTFTVAHTVNPANSLQVILNGQELKLTEDYTFTSPTITFNSAPDAGSILLVHYTRQP